MKMKKRCIVPSILLMLSLEAALLVAAGRPSTATSADDVGAILLPSEGKGDHDINFFPSSVQVASWCLRKQITTWLVN
jgi:hypothetical protein